MTSILKGRIARLGIAGRCCLLALVMGAALLAAMPIAYWLSGVGGLQGAVVAAAIVWFASAVGLVMGELFSRPDEALLSMLVAMLIRMLLPLAACLLAVLGGGPLRSAGFICLVLGFYLVALPVDTILSVVRLEEKIP